jgi:hypothetical protein
VLSGFQRMARLALRIEDLLAFLGIAGCLR